MRTSRQHRYPVTVQTFARRLHEKGYAHGEIRLALERQGYRPSHTTIRSWYDPETREKRNAQSRLKPSAFKRRATSAWQAKWQRMVILRNAGLSYPAVANVMNLDYGTELDGEQVRNLFRYPHPERKRRAIESRTNGQDSVVVGAEGG